MTKKLLVTGGSSFLGATILKRAPADWSIASTYYTHPITLPRVTLFRVDVRDARSVDHLFADFFQPDVVIHSPAVISGEAMLALNVDGSRNVARATKHARARLIHISTDAIFDGEHPPYTEDARPSPITPYGDSKALAERAVSAETSNIVIVRTSLIYGLDPIDLRTRQTLDGEMPRLFTDEFRCPILVDDLADALLELAQNDYTGVLNVAGPQRLSRYDLGLKTANAFHVAPKFEPALRASHASPRPGDCTLDISRARRILYTRLRSVDEALESR